jgi:hypothetical protein
MSGSEGKKVYKNEDVLGIGIWMGAVNEDWMASRYSNLESWIMK